MTVTPACCFTYDPQRYPYNRPYKGRYVFNKHYYSPVAVFDSDEEEEGACLIDTWPAVKFWVRNPARGSQAFWLQAVTDKCYPDFVCQLHDGRYLVIEYKGANRWSTDDSKEKRIIGEVWEKRSNGACLFMMSKGKDFAAIKARVEL